MNDSRMTLSWEDVVRLSERIRGAQAGAYAIRKLTDEYPNMNVTDAYAVQAELRRFGSGRGNRMLGWKIDFPFAGTRRPTYVQEPATGFLMSDMARPEGSAIPTADMVQPCVEGEIAFVTKRMICGPGCTKEEVLDGTDFVLPAVEIVDSRYTAFQFDLPSIIADNGSSARFVVGGRCRYPRELDLRTLGVVIEKNGETVAMAASAAVLGHPAEAIAWLVNILGAQDQVLPAGSFVMSGGITEAIPVKAGDNVIARFQELGTVSMRFV